MAMPSPATAAFVESFGAIAASMQRQLAERQVARARGELPEAVSAGRRRRNSPPAT